MAAVMKESASPARIARIDVQDQHEVGLWSRVLKVDEETLRCAVDAVGPSVEAVRQYLSGYPCPRLR